MSRRRWTTSTGLYLAGAPSSVHSQHARSLSDPRDASFNVPETGSEAAAERDTRADYEHRMVAEARLRGMPVMGVCAGSWRLAEAYGGSTETLPEADRDAHYRPGRDTWQTKHPVLTRPNTILGGTFPVQEGTRIDELGDGDEVVRSTQHVDRSRRIDAVNSTHWATPSVGIDGTLTPARAPATRGLAERQASGRLPRDPSAELEVSAIATEGSSLPTVEGFESRHGAPVLGVQWHPEGYLPGVPGREHGDPGAVAQADELFRGFSQASKAYRGRKAVNRELKARYRPSGD